MLTQINNDFHKNLANYFSKKPLYLDEPIQKKPNIRKLVEQPWQQTKGKMWDEVTDTLCNLDFIQAKSAAMLTYELVDDFNAALMVIPDNQKSIEKEKSRQARMDKYTNDLISYAKGEISELEIPKCIELRTKNQTDDEIKRIKTDPNIADRLREYFNFLGHESENLQRYASGLSNFSIQQAWNYADCGPVGKEAETGYPEKHRRLLCRTQPNRPLWNPKPLIIKILKGHNEKIWAVAITPDGKRAISGSNNNTCIYWDLLTGQPIFSLNGHEGYVGAVAITPDAQRAISGSWDNTCILWDLNTGRSIQILKGHTNYVRCVDITPDGQHAISGSDDNNCIFWSLSTGEPIHTLLGDKGHIQSVAITPNGQRAISGSWKTCVIWDLVTGKQIQSLQEPESSNNVIQLAYKKAVAITPDGKWAIASASTNYSCILWDLLTGELIQILQGHEFFVIAVAITPDGQRAISGSRDNSCKLWDLSSGQVIQTLKGHTSSIHSVAITPDGQFAISGSNDNNCIIWDLTSGKQNLTSNGHDDYVSSISIFPDSTKAVSSSYDYTCIIWDLITCQPIQTLKGHTSPINCVVITSDGLNAISGSGDKTCILWDIKNGQQIKILSGHNYSVGPIVVTPDRKRAIAGDGGNYNLWDLTSGQLIKILKAQSFYVEAITITPDGRYAITGFEDKPGIIWDLTGSQPEKTLYSYQKNTRAFAVTPDGKCVISGLPYGFCIVWNLITRQIIQTLEWHSRIIKTIAITPDGRKAISASLDNTCILWDLKTGQLIHTLEGHTGSVNNVFITPDGNNAISESEDKSIIFWELTTGKQLNRLATSFGISAISLSINAIILGMSNGEVMIINPYENFLCQSIAIATIKQIWDFELNRFTQPLVYCPLCGHCFEPPLKIIRIIIQILQDARLKPEQTPCLELPDKAWQHPGLLGECPLCHKKLKFNPFFGSDMNEILDYYSIQKRENKYRKYWMTLKQLLVKGNGMKPII